MKNLKSNNISKILIVRLSSMGDVVLTTHSVRCIRKAYPKAIIDYITLKNYFEILQYNPYIDNIFLFDKSFSKVEFNNFIGNIIALRGDYDMIIDLQNNFRSRKITSRLSKNVFRFDKRRLHKLSLVYFKKSLSKSNFKIPELYLKTAQPIVEDDYLGLEIWTKHDKENGSYLLSNSINNKNNFIIGIAPGAHFKTKRFPAEKFIQLIKIIKSKINAQFFLLGGKEDFELCEVIRKNDKSSIHNYAGSDSIQKTTEIVAQCDAFITNDTGLMHIASARNVPLVAIFGSSVIEFGFSPFRVNHFVIEKELDCRPCSHIGRDKCPKKHFNCMNLIDENEIADKLFNLLNI